MFCLQKIKIFLIEMVEIKITKMKETILTHLSHLLLKKLQQEEILYALADIENKLKTGEAEIKNSKSIIVALSNLQQFSIAFTKAISHLFKLLNQED